MSRQGNQRGAHRPTGHGERLLEKMPTGGVCAEIGLWEEDLCARILKVRKPRELDLIDPWEYEAVEVTKDLKCSSPLARFLGLGQAGHLEA